MGRTINLLHELSINIHACYNQRMINLGEKKFDKVKTSIIMRKSEKSIVYEQDRVRSSVISIDRFSCHQ